MQEPKHGRGTSPWVRYSIAAAKGCSSRGREGGGCTAVNRHCTHKQGHQPGARQVSRWPGLRAWHAAGQPSPQAMLADCAAAPGLPAPLSGRARPPRVAENGGLHGAALQQRRGGSPFLWTVCTKEPPQGSPWLRGLAPTATEPALRAREGSAQWAEGREGLCTCWAAKGRAHPSVLHRLPPPARLCQVLWPAQLQTRAHKASPKEGLTNEHAHALPL